MKEPFWFFLLSGFVKYYAESEISGTGAVCDEGLTDNTLFGSFEDEMSDNKLKAEMCWEKKRETERGKGVNERNSQSCRLFVPPVPTVAPGGISKGQRDAVTGEWAAVGVARVCVCVYVRDREAACAYATRICGGGRCGGEGDGLMAICPLSCP